MSQPNERDIAAIARIESDVSTFMDGLILRNDLPSIERQARFAVDMINGYLQDSVKAGAIAKFTLVSTHFLRSFSVQRNGVVVFDTYSLTNLKAPSHLLQWSLFNRKLKGDRSRRLIQMKAKRYVGTYRIKYALYLNPDSDESTDMQITKESYHA